MIRRAMRGVDTEEDKKQYAEKSTEGLPADRSAILRQVNAEIKFQQETPGGVESYLKEMMGRVDDAVQRQAIGDLSNIAFQLINKLAQIVAIKGKENRGQ
jgi:hypothetical protein